MNYPECRVSSPPDWRARPGVPLDVAPLPTSPAMRARALAIREAFLHDLDGFGNIREVLAACHQRGLLADLTPGSALEIVRRTLRPVALDGH